MAREIRPGTVFFDVGANVGFYSLLAARCVVTGRVYAFEPLPANIAFLRKHLEMNRVRNVRVLEVALSDESGMTSFLSESTRAMGKLEAGGSLTVETSTLDTLIAEQRIPAPDCIKMDIEGAEFRALRGAARCFREHRPLLFLATHGTTVHDDCCDLLASWGYKWIYTARDSSERAELFAQFSEKSPGLPGNRKLVQQC